MRTLARADPGGLLIVCEPGQTLLFNKSMYISGISVTGQQLGADVTQQRGSLLMMGNSKTIKWIKTNTNGRRNGNVRAEFAYSGEEIKRTKSCACSPSCEPR